MVFRPSTSRWAAWAFALALLLKAAVPMLATASAHAQGLPLAEVCTVYGVATVASPGQDSSPGPDHAAGAHAGEHCTLTALMALAAPEADPLAMPLALNHQGQAALIPRTSSHAPDACATWVARLKHGPPASA